MKPQELGDKTPRLLLPALVFRVYKTEQVDSVQLLRRIAHVPFSFVLDLLCSF